MIKMKYFQSGEEGKKLQMLVDLSMVKKETVTLSHVQVRISYCLTLEYQIDTNLQSKSFFCPAWVYSISGNNSVKLNDFYSAAGLRIYKALFV